MYCSSDTACYVVVVCTNLHLSSSTWTAHDSGLDDVGILFSTVCVCMCMCVCVFCIVVRSPWLNCPASRSLGMSVTLHPPTRWICARLSVSHRTHHDSAQFLCRPCFGTLIAQPMSYLAQLMFYLAQLSESGSLGDKIEALKKVITYTLQGDKFPTMLMVRVCISTHSTCPDQTHRLSLYLCHTIAPSCCFIISSILVDHPCCDCL
jgi:hypothetical protein